MWHPKNAIRYYKYLSGSKPGGILMGEYYEHNAGSEFTKSALAYDIGLDINTSESWQTQQQYVSEHEYNLGWQQITQLYKHNLITFIGELHNRLESPTTYQIRNNRIYHPDHSDPFLDVIHRGHMHRIGMGEEAREAAEEVGFQMIERVATDPGVPEWTVLVSASYPGKRLPDGRKSAYQKKFIDVGIVVGNGAHRQLEMIRYISYREFHELKDIRKQLAPDIPDPIEETAEYYLAHPFEVYPGTSGYLNKEQLRLLLQARKDGVTEEQFSVVAGSCEPLIDHYISLLQSFPVDRREVQRTLKAIINKSQEVVDRLSGPLQATNVTYLPTVGDIDRLPIAQQINLFSARAMKMYETGCGVIVDSGPNRITINARQSLQSILRNLRRPYRVNAYAEDDEETEEDMPSDRHGPLEQWCKTYQMTWMRDPGVLYMQCRLCEGSCVSCGTKRKKVIPLFENKDEEKSS